MYGKIQSKLQNEKTVFYPQSPYDVAKALCPLDYSKFRSLWFIIILNGILFNHESLRRGKYLLLKKLLQHFAKLNKKK